MCSRIDGSHVKKIIMSSSRLVEFINGAYRSNSVIKCFTELLKLLPLLWKCWTKVTINSYDSHLEEASACEKNINIFYKHDKNAIFTNTYVGVEKYFICIVLNTMCQELLETHWTC